MAIDVMKRVTILLPAHCTKRIIKSLHGLGVMELRDTLDQYGEARDVFTRPEALTEESDRLLTQINFCLNLIEGAVPNKKGFFEGLTPLPMVIDPKELEDTLQQFDLEAAYTAAHELDDAYKQAERALAEAQSRLAELKPFEDIPFAIGELAEPRHTRLVFGRMSPKNLAGLAENAEAVQVLAWSNIPPAQHLRKNGSGAGEAQPPAPIIDSNRIVFAYLREDEAAARKLLSSNGFEEIPLPIVRGKVRDHVRELTGDIAESTGQLGQITTKICALAPSRHALLILRAFWESNRLRALASAQTASGKWVQVLTGYIRAKDAGLLESTLKRDFPEVSLTVEEPAPGEDVPVSISLRPTVRPIQMLVSMFGLPPYTSFDPSPFIIGNFLIFFGICFGDVGYGSMLIAFSLFLMAKTKTYEGVYNFARLLFYAGISTVIFGALFGSWLGDLPSAKYLGENNFFFQAQQKVIVLDPLAKPVVMLVVALVIGMLNQFYGITLKMYGAARKGDWAAAVFDGLFWLITLPGMVIMVSKMFAPVPPALFNLGVGCFFLGALGLVLTQGRAEKTFMAKAITGVVSLYGIVGSYGCTAFLGDTLSYCRLLALGLTTSIVALSINMMAGMLRDIPYVGMVLFVALLIFGHVFNFLISLLGAFVHAMRLIFVEFFGRFYEGGSKPFKPLSFDSPAFVLKRPPETAG